MGRCKQKQTKASTGATPSAMTHLTVAFEGQPLTTYVFRGRPCWIAADVGKPLDYADEGKKLVDSIRDEWSDELVAGEDFEVLTGAKLREFKEIVEATRPGRVGRAAHVMVLYESGVNLVCLLTRKPVGRKLRRLLADDVLPKLRRGETIGRVDDFGAPMPLLREFFRDDARDYEPFWDGDIVGEFCRTFRIQNGPRFPAPLFGVIGKLYRERLGDDAHQELKRLNPSGPERDMHHQRFSDRLLETFEGDKAAIRALLLVSSSKHQFWELWSTYCNGRGQLRLGW